MSDPPTTSVAAQPLALNGQFTDSQSSINYRCGVCCWRPRCLKPLSNICAFLAAACFVSCLQAAFSGYIASQVTTLEKRFAIGSSVIGFINGFFEVGYIVSVIFVSYAGGRGHVPSVISVGLFIMAAGAILWSMPHFIFPYDKTYLKAHTTNPLCSRSSALGKEASPPVCMQDRTSGWGFLPLIFLAQLLIGSGSSPILTLIPPFIDDHVHASKAPRMIAAQYASSAMGPVLGFAIGAFVLRYPADFYTSSPLKPDDPNWIGAWWTGFIFFSILVTIGGFILLLFPRRLNKCMGHQSPKPANTLTISQSFLENGIIPVPDPSAVPATSNHNKTATTEPNLELRETPKIKIESKPNDSVSHDSTGVSDNARSTCRPCSRLSRSPNSCKRLFAHPSKSTNFLGSVRSLLRNRVYIVVCLGICSEMFMVIGFASFLPKYLEMEYQVTKSSASMIAGGIIVPVGAFGILVGGLILQRFSFHRRDAIRFVLIVNAIIVGCITSFFFLGCENPPIVGVTVAYPYRISDSDPTAFEWPSTTTFKPKFPLTNPCNADCNCDANLWFPVCYPKRSVSFASPCFAGCTNSSVTQDSFNQCSCMLGSSSDADGLQSGICPLKCGRLGYFVFVLAVCLFLTGVIQNPLIMVTMRSVSHHERAFALGLQFVIIRLLANLPSPMVFGRVIDEACLFWRSTCGRRGDCAFVDVRALNLYMTSLGMAIKGSGFIFYIVLFYLLRMYPSTRTASMNASQPGVPDFIRKPSAPLSGPEAAHRRTTTANDE